MPQRCVATRPEAISTWNQLVLDHLPLVRKVAESVRAKIPAQVESDDLIHDGICGLIEAAKRYDVTRKVLFATYAQHRIRGDVRAGEAFDADAAVARAELRAALAAALAALPRRDRQIVILHHWRGITMREVGRPFRINESRVSQIHKRALERMSGVLRTFGITSGNSILLR